MLGIMIRKVTVVALLAGVLTPNPGWTTTRASDQPPQDVRATPVGADKIHVSWLDPTKTAEPTNDYVYMIQWKSGTQEYSETRQAVTTGIDEDKAERARFLGQYTLRYDLFYLITGLETGVEYTFRVIRTGADGDSRPSNEATATPITPEAILRMTVENLILEYGDDSPWIQQTWEYFHKIDVPFYVDEVGSSIGGSYDDRCYDPDQLSALHRCTTRSIEIDDPMMEDVILHEFAHAYSLDVKILEDHPDKAEGMAIALMYVGTFLNEPNNACNRVEFLADVMSFWELGDKYDPWYWTFCGYPSIPDEALEVVGGALMGERPEWFIETYSVSGALDLEKLWTDIQQFTPRIARRHEQEQIHVVYHLRNSFGGYCDEANATASMFGNGPTRNPWRDGGCVPTAPAIDANTHGDGDLLVSWNTPAYDGGAPIEGYKVQWRSGGQRYGGSREAVISNPSTLRYRLHGLLPGIQHHVRVLAYNTNGEGTPSDELAGLITGPSAVSPWSRIWPGWLIGLRVP